MAETRCVHLEVGSFNDGWCVYQTEPVPLKSAPQPWCEGFIAGYLGAHEWDAFYATVLEDGIAVACYCSQKELGESACDLCDHCPIAQRQALMRGSGVCDA